MKYILLTLVFLFTSLPIKAQANDTEALLYNIGISGFFGTIGAIINKKPNQKPLPVLVKGFSQGALGGVVTFSSKCLLRETQRNQNWKYIWPSKIVNAAGTSIIENAAMNRNFWEKWHINIGFNRIEFETKDHFKINYKLMPVAFIFITDAFFRFDKFEINQSLKTGEFIFSNNILNAKGATLPGYIVLQTKYVENYYTITHEIIHIYQSNTFSVLNTYFQKPLNQFSEKNKTTNFINKYLYLDLQYIPLKLIYNTEQKSALNYYDNFFEHEAGYYSNTLR